MNDIDIALSQIGRDLRSAARSDLARSGRRSYMSQRRMFALIAAIVAVLVAVGAGIAAGVLKTTSQEEVGLLNGAATFAGTHPVCKQLAADHFSCVLETTPTELTFSDGASYRGVKMGSVDATKHVDGGCVAISDDGRAWDCYLGQEAVRRGIIDSGYLGQFVPAPPHA
jgi:hypothetical protein